MKASFTDSSREQKRREVIKKSLSSSENAIKMLKKAGIITEKGNVSPKYRL
jgi:hypothetical protein